MNPPYRMYFISFLVVKQIWNLGHAISKVYVTTNKDTRIYSNDADDDVYNKISFAQLWLTIDLEC